LRQYVGKLLCLLKQLCWNVIFNIVLTKRFQQFLKFLCLFFVFLLYFFKLLRLECHLLRCAVLNYVFGLLVGYLGIVCGLFDLHLVNLDGILCNLNCMLFFVLDGFLDYLDDMLTALFRDFLVVFFQFLIGLFHGLINRLFGLLRRSFRLFFLFLNKNITFSVIVLFIHIVLFICIFIVDIIILCVGVVDGVFQGQSELLRAPS